MFLDDTRDGENYFKGVAIDKKKLYNLLEGNERNILFFCNVIEDDKGEIQGCLTAFVMELIFSKECIAADQVLFVSPDYNKPKAVSELIKTYIEWAERRNVRDVYLRNSTGIKQKEFGLFCERLGFTQFEVGYSKRIM